VGEPVADGLDFWGEGEEVTLPYSGLRVHASEWFDSFSAVPHPEHEEYLDKDLSISSLAPDIPVAMSSADFFGGKDPVLQAVERYGK